MKLAFLIAVVLTGCNACQPTVSPTPTPVSDETVYNELVAGGCLAASDGGVAAVAAEHAGPNPIWLNCLYQPGAGVTVCAVPCGH